MTNSKVFKKGMKNLYYAARQVIRKALASTY